ncbi:MAG: hypothetical protein COB02_16195 [Candidatus Cloacimonadota bacterium]|nr:MAG: hypothetical protein COB02_16195 [Candidatus Cloacimonadota bacterium]
MCPNEILKKYSIKHRSKIRSNRQTINVNLQDEAIFKIFNYQSFQFESHNFTVRYITSLQSGSDLIFWVKGKKSPSTQEILLSDWHTTTPNLLNSPLVNNSSNLTQLQSDRFSVLSKLANTLKFEIIPKMEKVTKKITEHESPRFKGIHILLYDIKDSFEQDEAFFGGYLDPVDQESAPNGPVNLIHMDIYPMTPGGRVSPAKVTQKDFYHTITHELFHLYHYQRSKVLNNTWGVIGNWLKEGLAQLAVYEFTKDSKFYQSNEKILDVKNEYVSQLSSYFELKTPISIFDNFFENYGLNYIWLSFLLDKKIGGNRVKLFNDLLEKTDCAIVDPRLCINGFSKTLGNNGLDLNEELLKFSIAQFYNHEGLTLSSISNSTYTSLEKILSSTQVFISSLDQQSLEESSNYQIKYQPIINDSSKYQSIKFSSNTSFILAKYPSLFVIESCKTSNDFQSCFLSLENDLIISSGKSITLNFRPNEKSLMIYSFINHPFGDRVKHFLTSDILSSHNFEDGPFFKSRPKLKIVSNSLQIEFKIENNNLESISTKFDISYSFFNKNQKYPLKTNDFKIDISPDNLYRYTLYTDNDEISLNSLNLDISLVNIENSKIGETFSHTFISSYPLQLETYTQQLYEGWNSISIYQSEENQSFEKYLNINQFDSNDCIYTYVNFSFFNLSDNCSISLSPISTMIFSNGIGIYVKSDKNKELILSRNKLARTKITLNKGWNFKSLSFHDKQKEFNQSGNTPISYGYNAQSKLWDSIYNFGDNRPIINGNELNRLFGFRAFFIYSLNKHSYYSY